MADPLLGAMVQVQVEKAINLASEEIGLFFGFKKDLEKLKKTLTLIDAVLQDAEKKQVTEELVKLWLEELERVAFDAGNLLDDFNYEMIGRKVEIQNQMKRKVCFFFSLSNPVAFRCKMAHKIHKINMDLIRINEQVSTLRLIKASDAPALSPPGGRGTRKNRETDSVTVDISFVGRDGDVSEIVTQLTATGNNETVSVLPIVGMGGIGKTTLARNIFNDPKIKEHFQKRMWVCVSDDFNANRLFGLMLESLESKKPKAESMEARVNRLKELLDGDDKKYLLVLDDVWYEEKLFELWGGFLGSLKGISQAIGNWILVTTREQQVANITRIASPGDHPLEKLSVDQCWLILKENAVGSGQVSNKERDIGFRLAQKCRGLPLAARVLGGKLRIDQTDNKWETLESKLQNLGGGETIAIGEILKLSFDHLPDLPLKKCFAYCSIFPKDFEMEKNQLIQLWAAEGFLLSNPGKNMCMEEVGNMYFTILLDSNLFQDAKKDKDGNVLNCKMHDLVHDMVQSISKSRALRLTGSGNVDTETFHIRYLALERSGVEVPFPSTEKFKCITTLFLLENRSLNDREMSFSMLHVLSLRSRFVWELPKSIGKLTHLRYLDLSRTSIKTIPDSLCRLYNLQTLRVRDCESLTTFPNNFQNLVNLSHFELQNCTNCKKLPTLGRMPSLRSLHLKGLDGITSIGPSFYGGLAMHSRSSSHSPLELFPALKHFILRDMRNLTRWTEAIVHDRTVVVFPVLEMLEINRCRELANVPNHFPCLKKLSIEGTDRGSAIMAHICSGVSTLTSLRIANMSGLTDLPVTLFQNNPGLAEIRLNLCFDLTQFLDLSFDDVPQTLEGPNSQTILELSQPHTCIDSNAAQHLVGLESLKKLRIVDCDSLMSISIPKGYKYLTALRELTIAACHKLTHLSIPQISESVGDTTSSPSPSSARPPLLDLEELIVWGCYGLISFPIDLTRTPSLSFLNISKCVRLTDLPKGKLCSLTSLRKLWIGPFSETTELHSFLDLFDALQPPTRPYLPSLSRLDLYGWPHGESLPDQLQHLSALTRLQLGGFGVKSLPDWFGNLSSLEILSLWNCEKLKNLPSHQSMRSLTRLRELDINSCPLLKERCKPESSSTDPHSEWSKICRIPKIEIDLQRIRG